MKKIIYTFLFSLSIIICSAQETNKVPETSINDSDQKIATFLTFQKNDAEEAMNFYIRLFDNSKVISVHRWGEDGPGKEGTIMHASFQLNGQSFMCSDSQPIHNWDFTPAVSNYVECENIAEIAKALPIFIYILA